MTILDINDAHKRVIQWCKRDLDHMGVRAIIDRGVTCQRFEGAPFLTPPPPPLPVSRVNEGPTFSFTGVDYAGPLMVHAEGFSSTSSRALCYKSRARRYCPGHVY